MPRIHTSDRSEKRPRHVEPQCDLSGSAAFQDFFLMLTFHMPEESEGYKRSRCADDNQIEGKEKKEILGKGEMRLGLRMQENGTKRELWF